MGVLQFGRGKAPAAPAPAPSGFITVGQPEVFLIADRRLWLDAAKEKLLEDGDSSAAFQLCAAEGKIPLDEVKRLRLVLVDGKVQQQK